MKHQKLDFMVKYDFSSLNCRVLKPGRCQNGMSNSLSNWLSILLWEEGVGEEGRHKQMKILWQNEHYTVSYYSSSVYYKICSEQKMLESL